MALEVNMEQMMQKLYKELTPGILRQGVKKGLGKVAKRGQQMAQERLMSGTGGRVMGNKTTWKKQVRSYVYSKGGGYLISVMPHRKQGFHQNRFYSKTKREMPILKWLEEGTKARETRGNKRRAHSTGSVKKGLNILKQEEPRILRMTEMMAAKEVEKEIDRIKREF